MNHVHSDLRYACPLERPAPRPYPRALWVCLAIGLLWAIFEGVTR